MRCDSGLQHPLEWIWGSHIRAQEYALLEVADRREVGYPGASVEADRHVEPLGFFIEREEIGIARPVIRFLVALLEHTASPVVFGESELVDRLVHRSRGR